MSAKKVGPFTVDDEQEFTLADLRKIGEFHREDGQRVFVDYDGTNKGWYEREIGDGPDLFDTKKTRRSVLKAMVTRRDNKRRLAAFKARQEAN